MLKRTHSWTSEFQRWEGVLDTIYFETAKYNALGGDCALVSARYKAKGLQKHVRSSYSSLST